MWGFTTFRDALEVHRLNMRNPRAYRITVFALPLLWFAYIAIASKAVVEGKMYFVVYLIFGISYPCYLAWYNLRSRRYEVVISARGLSVNGQPVSWKNFRGYLEAEDKLYLVTNWGSSPIPTAFR